MVSSSSIPLFIASLVVLPDSSVWSVPWSWEPTITVPLVLFAITYTAGALHRGSIGILRWRHACFVAGWLSLVLALDSPIHELGEELFSAHMLQHEILILISAPLVAASHPAATLLWAFAPGHRARLGGWVHKIEHGLLFSQLTRPLTAWLLEAAALWLWHIPALYQATLTSDWVHAAQHLSFFMTAVLFWSALYGAGRSAMGYGNATLYVFATAVHCTALGALLTFSRVLWYPAYTASTQHWGLTPVQDQQLGGALMWVPTDVVFIAIALVLITRWLSESDRRVRVGALQAAMEREQGI